MSKLVTPHRFCYTTINSMEAKGELTHEKDQTHSEKMVPLDKKGMAYSAGTDNSRTCRISF